MSPKKVPHPTDPSSSNDAMGRSTLQTLETPSALMIQAQYGFNSDGVLTDLYYPGAANAAASVQPGQHFQYSPDIMGRSLGVQRNDSGTWTTLASSATYTAA